MKTLNNLVVINVTESTVLENGAEVLYRLNGKICTVTVTETKEVGTVMSKYFNTSIRIHPVAKDESGKFVSISLYKDILLRAGIESGWIVFNTNNIDENVNKSSNTKASLTSSPCINTMSDIKDNFSVGNNTSNIKNTSQLYKDDKTKMSIKAVTMCANPISYVYLNGKDNFFTEFYTSSNKKIELSISKPIKQEPIKRSKGSRSLAKIDIKPVFNPMQEELNLEVSPFPYIENTTPFSEGNFIDPFEEANMLNSQETYSIYEDVYIEHNTPIYTDNSNDLLSIVKQAARIFYDYFSCELRLKTINTEQLLKQFGYIWANNTQLHTSKREMKLYIFDVIKASFSEALSSGSYVKRYMTKQELILVVAKALKGSVEQVEALGYIEVV